MAEHLKGLSPKERKQFRRLEMIPGSLVWLTFILAIVLSFIKPLWVIYFIIVFDLYWLIRVSYFVFYLFISMRRYKAAVSTDWLPLVKKQDNWQRIYHLVFLPTVKEPVEVLRTTLDAILASGYPPDKIMIVLAGEERAEEHFNPKAKQLQEEYGNKFYKFWTTRHPADLPGEIIGKGSNLNYSGHLIKKKIDQLDIPYEDIIVTSFDCDTSAHPQYFACLTYKYLTHPKPTRTSYQPIAFYNNNMWQANPVMRITAFGTTFWIMTELCRPERLYTFSSHSMSFKMLVDVGFWQKDIVTEDSRIFLQGFFKYDGDYSTTPMFIPVSMDTVEAGNWKISFKNLYKQQRRWAWGVEHFPYMLWRFRKNKKIPWLKKLYYGWNLGEGMYSWATAPILIFLLGRLPLAVAGNDPHLIVQNAPFVLEKLMAVAMVGIYASAFISLFLLPPMPKQYKRWSWLIMLLQWILLPLTLIVFGSIPATDAQTRLMLGKYLGFWVTEKARK